MKLFKLYSICQEIQLHLQNDKNSQIAVFSL
jgi:hypothetical protein